MTKREFTSSLLLFVTFLNLALFSMHFRDQKHILNPEKGQIEHQQNHKCSNHRFISSSYLPHNQFFHEKHEHCTVLDSFFKQIIESKNFAIVEARLFGTLYHNSCRKEFHSSANILFFAPKLSPPHIQSML